jgi:membrane-associated HD superfamily phosphohydrolase
LKQFDVKVGLKHGTFFSTLGCLFGLLIIFFTFTLIFFLLNALDLTANKNRLGHAIVNDFLSLVVAHGVLPVLEMGFGDGLIKLIL